MSLKKIKNKGYTFVFDDDQLVSLTTLWKQMGAVPKKNPAIWWKMESVQAYLMQLQERANNTDLKIKKVNNGTMFAHWEVALMYSAFLSSKMKTAFIKVFRQRFHIDPYAEETIDAYQNEIEN